MGDVQMSTLEFNILLRSHSQSCLWTNVSETCLAWENTDNFLIVFTSGQQGQDGQQVADYSQTGMSDMKFPRSSTETDPIESKK